MRDQEAVAVGPAADSWDALRRAVASDVLITDPDILEAASRDSARFCDAGTPAALARPRCTEEVQAVLRWANQHRVPVVPQGGLTGRAGAANAVDGAVLLSLTRMRRIVQIDPVGRVAVVEPGVLNAELSRAALELGLFYPPDPSSWESCTIGGNVATNAGGLCCVRYGVTGDYVRALEVVLADGEVIRTGTATAKGVAGLDLTRLLVGSEGTLGVITQATLALRPKPPRALTVVAVFEKVTDAMEAVTRIIGSGLRPSLAEFMDGETIRAVQSYRDMGLPLEAEALLLLQSDQPGALAVADVTQMERLCEAAGAQEVARADDEAEGELLLAARRAVGHAVDLLGATFVEDVTVPIRCLVELLAGIEHIAATQGVRIATCGHAGDGNMHPTVVFDAADAAERARAKRAFDDIMALALRLGGTITGEHGVGLLKREWLGIELGDRGLELQRAVKRAFDPHGILNPGKVL